MNSALVTLTDMNTRFEDLLKPQGYEVHPWGLETNTQEGRVAENEYFAVAFQPFDAWDTLVAAAGPAELELAASMKRGSSKVWDTYLLLACRESLYSRDQYDRLVQIQYDTRRMRKLVVTGVGDELSALETIVRPFMALQKLKESTQARDPLATLTQKLMAQGYRREMLDRAVSLFRDGRSLDAL